MPATPLTVPAILKMMDAAKRRNLDVALAQLSACRETAWIGGYVSVPVAALDDMLGALPALLAAADKAESA
jgi:hypothetical protein